MGPSDALASDSPIFVLIGASAVGKSATAEGLCEAGLTEATPTWTTRQPRPGELDTSYDHHFVSDDEFDRHSGSGGFMEERELYGARYGIPFLLAPAEGTEPLMVLKPVFIPMFIRHYPGSPDLSYRSFPFHSAGTYAGPRQSREDIDRRMLVHDSETAEGRRLAHAVFNNDGPLDQTILSVATQIYSDRQAFQSGKIHSAESLADQLKNCQKTPRITV